MKRLSKYRSNRPLEDDFPFQELYADFMCRLPLKLKKKSGLPPLDHITNHKKAREGKLKSGMYRTGIMMNGVTGFGNSQYFLDRHPLRKGNDSLFLLHPWDVEFQFYFRFYPAVRFFKHESFCLTNWQVARYSDVFDKNKN